MRPSRLWQRVWAKVRPPGNVDVGPLDPADERQLRPRLDPRTDARGNTGFAPQGPYGYDEGKPKK